MGDQWGTDVNEAIRRNGEITADEVLTRLRAEARNLGRPEKRLATLDRLQKACDDLASGKAADYVRDAAESDPIMARVFKAHFKWGAVAIKPPRIEEYVKARRLLDQQNGEMSSWTGPMAATIRGEPDGLLAYVRRREIECECGNVRHGKSVIDGFVDSIPDLDVRQAIRIELEVGQEAIRQLRMIKQGLQQIPQIDVYAILGEKKGPAALPSGTGAESTSVPCKNRDVELIRELLARLADNNFLAGFDLQADGKRVKNKATKEALISNTEMAALKRVVG